MLRNLDSSNVILRQSIHSSSLCNEGLCIQGLPVLALFSLGYSIANITLSCIAAPFKHRPLSLYAASPSFSRFEIFPQLLSFLAIWLILSSTFIQSVKSVSCSGISISSILGSPSRKKAMEFTTGTTLSLKL